MIVAISLEPRTLVRTCSENGEIQLQERFVSDDPNDLVGPPYFVSEQVFDEYDLEGCFTSRPNIRKPDNRKKHRHWDRFLK